MLANLVHLAADLAYVTHKALHTGLNASNPTRPFELSSASFKITSCLCLCRLPESTNGRTHRPANAQRPRSDTRHCSGEDALRAGGLQSLQVPRLLALHAEASDPSSGSHQPSGGEANLGRGVVHEELVEFAWPTTQVNEAVQG